jgi:hypothetical protein
MRSAKLLLSKPLRLAAAIALGVAAPVLASPPAAAQTEDDLSRLRALFIEGRQLEGKGQWAEALKRFEAVAASKMTPQVRFHMALCEENLGRLVSALHGFELAATEAKELGSSGADALTPAREHADAIRARIAKLQIDVHGKLVTSKVLLDEAALPPKDLGVEVPVDPGPHVVDVRDAAGKVTFHKDLTLPEKGAQRVDVTVDDHDAPTAPPDNGGAASSSGGGSRVPAIVVGSVGLAAIVGSGVFFGLRAANVSDVESHCNPPGSTTGCSPGDQSLASQGRAFTIAADTLLGVGIAGAVTAGVLWFTLGPKKQAQPAAASSKAASIRVAPMGTGVRVLGAF